jgi:dienelactone hydrolase
MSRSIPGPSSSRPTIEYLRHRGPHRVVSGDLAAIGIPGVVFAPFTGPRCPAVVFGHGFLQPVGRYADTLRMLASWGFVAAAPATERGILPSHSGLAMDMSRTLDRLADAKLHNGRVTVDGRRLAAMGHGIGGGAAVLATAAGAPPVQATVTIFASPTSPSAVDAATRITTPGLHLVGGSDRLDDPDTGGAALARAWGGPVQLRRIKRARHLSVTEGKHITSTLLKDRPSRSVAATTRTLVTAFLLVHLAGQDQLAEELDGKIGGTTLIPVDVPVDAAHA